LKTPQMDSFDPKAPGKAGEYLFGVPCSEEESNLVVLPVPWEVTTSYQRGTAQGPQSILEASPQLDLFDPFGLAFGHPNPWQFGMHMRSISSEVVEWNRKTSESAVLVIQHLEGKITLNGSMLDTLIREVNESSHRLNTWVAEQTRSIVQQQKIPAILGGDHSVPFGAIEVLSQAHPGLGILHIDAHADLREAYEGFEYSHASIMNNVIQKCANVSHLVQVGIRDFSEEEYIFSRDHPKIKTFYDSQISASLSMGKSWYALVQDILKDLPQKIWISFDIDGLDPSLCPHTGTPVPGGLSYNQSCQIIQWVVESGREIVGFDLNEVAPPPKEFGVWDANVGARLLYKLCSAALYSKLRLRG